MNTDTIKEAVAVLPTTAGVYNFLNSSGEIIYVGKAKNLKRRVASYFVNSASHTPKVRVMVRQIAEIRHIDVPAERDALLLENAMIKELRPRYNTMLKDDKTYPWIIITEEAFPRILSVRRKENRGVYFGPYPSVWVQKNILELIHSIYLVRTCSLKLTPEAIAAGKFGVCLQYHIGNCKAPCVGKQSQQEYNASLELIKKMLRGELRTTREWLKKQMGDASEMLNYELASRFKNRLDRLDAYESKSVIVSNTLGRLDVFSLLVDEGGDTAYCNYVKVSQGSVVASFTVTLSVGADDEKSVILSRAIELIAESIDAPLAREIVVPFLPETELFEGIRFTVPERGDKLKLLEFSRQSARMYRLDQLKNLEIHNPERHTERVMEAMRAAFHLEHQPRHIECFDNSNIQGAYPVASCVVFRDGKPSKREYRHFHVKTVVGADDFASMREIVGRRYSRMLVEGEELPDLIVVDGGKGQLNSAYRVLQELGIADRVPVVGLAKRIEEIFFPNDPMPYNLDRNGEPLKVVMRLRDEAHRFGITFHRNVRSADFARSQIEHIDGIGRKSADALLTKFRTVKRLKSASMEEIAEVVGKSRAEKIMSELHNSQ